MRELWITASYLMFLVVGVTAPFVLSLGYIWVDIVTPQYLSSYLSPFPVSMIMAIAAIVGYLVMDRKKPPRFNTVTVLILAMAAWSTLSLTWAVAPGTAELKWDAAVKTMCFAAFLPCVFRSRVQIEAFVQVYMMTMCLHILPTGLKTVVSGGSGAGYGRGVGLVIGNAGLSESSTLAAVCLMAIPLLLFLRQHSILVPRTRMVRMMYAALAFIAVFAAVGTYARTAIVGFAVLAILLWARSKQKLMFGVVLAVVMGLASLAMTASWETRIATTSDYQEEDSALTRLLVWQWTIGYVMQNPLGGSFGANAISEVPVKANPDNPEAPRVMRGWAFHSVYFEVLGEQGFIGFGIFLGLIVGSLSSLQGVIRRTRHIPELAWCGDMARAVQASLLTLLAGGAFVGIAFQPMIWYEFAMCVMVAQYVRRVLAPKTQQGIAARMAQQPEGLRSRVA